MTRNDVSPTAAQFPATRGDIERLTGQIAELRQLVTSGPSRLLSPRAFGVVVGVSEGKVYGLLRDGLPYVQIGCQRRIDPAEAIAWLRARERADTWAKAFAKE